VSSVVIKEASRGACCDESPLLDGSMCLMPACVKADADNVVGVVAPDESGEEVAAGAIVRCSDRLL
jgi:hypothetical protein